MREESLDFLQESMEFENWVLTMGSSLIFKGNSLDDWNKELQIPTVSSSSELSLSEVEVLNGKALSLIEVVMSNLSIAKSSFFAAKAAHEINMIKTRRSIIESCELANSRIPSNENLEKQCSLTCLKTYKILMMSEIVFEFWNIQSFKLNRFNERLTSINISKQKL